jgi:hypothetical protein
MCNLKVPLKYNLLFVVIIFFSCGGNSKMLDMGPFTMKVPDNWKLIKEKGTDSFVGEIVIDKTDTVSFDLGRYSNPLDEEKPYMVEGNRVHLINKEKSKPHSTVYDYYGQADTILLEKFLKNKTTFEKIDGKNVKIIRPKKPGHGMTGIFIDSLRINDSGIIRFQLNGTDLKPQNEELLLKALMTIKFIS